MSAPLSGLVISTFIITGYCRSGKKLVQDIRTVVILRYKARKVTRMRSIMADKLWAIASLIKHKALTHLQQNDAFFYIDICKISLQRATIVQFSTFCLNTLVFLS